ncbi:response regulator [bacterium]|nr:response regulator [bacterium]
MKKILIVDDQIFYLRTIDLSLQGRYETYPCQNIDDALEILRTKDIDLALLDIRLDNNDDGNTDGISILEWIKKNKEEIICFMMSAYKEFSYAEKSLNLGAVYFFKKPIDISEMIEIIEEKG